MEILVVIIVALVVMLITTIYAAGKISGAISRSEEDNDRTP
jgi:hypothetical protein